MEHSSTTRLALRGLENHFRCERTRKLIIEGYLVSAYMQAGLYRSEDPHAMESLHQYAMEQRPRMFNQAGEVCYHYEVNPFKAIGFLPKRY